MIHINNCEQGSPEWFECRKGLMTASNATAIGNNSKGLETYIKKIMAEKYSTAEFENYTNKDIERGKELEEQARELYSLTTGEEVKICGFVTNDKYELAGASPDGIMKNGNIEIKCLNDVKHFEQIIAEEIEVESGYLWQMQMQMMITEKEWTDYVLYNPSFKKSLLIKRVLKDEEYFKKLQVGLLTGKELVNKIELKLTKS